MELHTFLAVGTVSEKKIFVDVGQTAASVGSGSLDVLATPVIITLVEQVAHKMLENVLPAGWTSVGTFVALHHNAPTPVGCSVAVECTVAEIRGREATFNTVVTDANGKVAEGTHKRVAIDARRFLAKVAERECRDR